MILTVALSIVLNSSNALVPQDALPRRGTLGVPFTPLPADQAAKFKLEPGTGLVALKPVPGLTADRAGVREGDVLIKLNRESVKPASVGALIRTLPSGKEVKLTVLRDGKPTELTAVLSEKPRDPGNANYRVEYRHVVSHGQKMRTILTFPKGTSGKSPAVFFIQGFSPISYDYTLETSKGDVSTIDGPILFDLANSGFVTMRVEKPGVGDSEGGPFAELDYTTELDIYRQALKQLKEAEQVDTEKVFIFGHSMGGSFGPMIAVENPVRGIAVYGTAARTWYEYLLDTLRYQGLVAGGSFEDADEEVRQGSRLMSLVFQEGKTVAEVKKSHPELAKTADSLMPGGLFNGKTLKFWAQLGQTNFAKYWAKTNARVLSVRGFSDFVTYDADHKLIADVVNRVHPGWGKFVVAPDMDHLFHRFPTEQASMANWQRGTFNRDFSKLLIDWIKEVLAAK